MRCCKGWGLLLLALVVATPVAAQITIDSDRTITSVDAGDLVEGFTINNSAVLTIAAGTDVIVSGPVVIEENGRLVVAGTLAEPVRIVFGGAVSLDHRPATATGTGMDFLHSTVTVAGTSFSAGHGEANTYQGGAFPGIAFRSSIVEFATTSATLDELNYVGESSLFFGNGRLFNFTRSNVQFTDCVFIRRSRPTNLTLAANALMSFGSTSGEHLFQNCRFSAAIVVYSFSDSSFRFVACDFSDTEQSFHNSFSMQSLTFEDSIVSPVNNSNRGTQSYNFTGCFPDLPDDELVINQAASTSVTITNPLGTPPFRSGDVNNDGVVNATDVTDLMEIVVGNASAGDLDFPERADADGNGVVDERDVAVLRAFVDGILPQLPEVVSP